MNFDLQTEQNPLSYLDLVVIYCILQHFITLWTLKPSVVRTDPIFCPSCNYGNLACNLIIQMTFITGKHANGSMGHYRGNRSDDIIIAFLCKSSLSKYVPCGEQK